MRFLPVLLTALAVAGGACNGAQGLEALEVVAGPGLDQSAVGLDQPLVVEFNQRLDPFLRAGAFELRRGKRGRACDVASYEVSGRLLILHPELPKLPDLSDGTLQPGKRYTLWLTGVPKLAAISSEEGASLVGSRLLSFDTLAANERGALTGEAAVGGPLELSLSRSGQQPVAFVDAEGWAWIGVRSGIDPRSLEEPARLLKLNEPHPAEVPLELTANTIHGAELRARVGSIGAWAALELPAGIEGLGGRRLIESDRAVRLLPQP